jgi:hypothetical protein
VRLCSSLDKLLDASSSHCSCSTRVVPEPRSGCQRVVRSLDLSTSQTTPCNPAPHPSSSSGCLSTNLFWVFLNIFIAKNQCQEIPLELRLPKQVCSSAVLKEMGTMPRLQHLSTFWVQLTFVRVEWNCISTLIWMPFIWYYNLSAQKIRLATFIQPYSDLIWLCKYIFNL